jgi:hypothetical protein
VENKKYFFCYSLKLKLFLKSLGFRYELSGNNSRTSKPYWVYIRTNELGLALDKWNTVNNYPNK